MFVCGIYKHMHTSMHTHCISNLRLPCMASNSSTNLSRFNNSARRAGADPGILNGPGGLKKVVVDVQFFGNPTLSYMSFSSFQEEEISFM